MVEHLPPGHLPPGHLPPGHLPTPPVEDYWVEGMWVDGNGVVQVVSVSWDTSVADGDIYILGTRHRSDGAMYITTDGVGNTGDVSINGILHSALGARYIDTTLSGELNISKGFVANATGVQSVKHTTLTVTPGGSYNHGIRRSSSGEMIINLIEPGAILMEDGNFLLLESGGLLLLE